MRDLRVRWALEEAGLPYRVESTPFRERGAEHLANQPFGQAPWLTDGDISIFESGAILPHLGERTDALIPADPRGRSKVLEWLLATAQFRGDGEPALVPVQFPRRYRRYAGAKASGRIPESPASAHGEGPGGTRIAGRDLLSC